MRKKRILFTPLTSSSLAHIVRSFAIAEKLKRDGWEIGFTSCNIKKKFIEKQGYKIIKTYEPFNLNDPKDQSENYMKTHYSQLKSWFSAELKAAEEFKPDIVVSSPAFTGPFITYKYGIPVIGLLNGQYAPTAKCLQGISLCAPNFATSLKRLFAQPILESAIHRKYLSYVYSALNDLGIHNFDTNPLKFYEPMYTLIPGDEEFEPQDFTKNYEGFIKHVGPIFWKGFTRMSSLTSKMIKMFKEDDILIYLTFGGSVFDKNIYESVIKEIEQLRDGIKILVSTGPNIDPGAINIQSKNLSIYRYVPGLLVAQYADIIINTGAQGSIMQALYHGKPVIAFPVGIDQSFFANRLEELHLGINVNPLPLYKMSKRENYHHIIHNIKGRIIKGVERILTEPYFAQNTRNYARRLKLRHPNPIDEITKIIEIICQ